MRDEFLWAPARLIHFIDHVDVNELTSAVPNANAIFHSQTRGQCASQKEVAVWTPFEHTAVARVEREQFPVGEALAVPDIDGASEVAESSKAEEAALWVVGNQVAWLCAKLGNHIHVVREDNGLRWHVSVNDDEFATVGIPLKVVDRALLVKADTTVKVAPSREHVQIRLAVVRFACLVMIRRCH